MNHFSIGPRFPQIIFPDDSHSAQSATQSVSCQGQSLKLYHRTEGDNLQTRKTSTSFASLLVPSPRRRRNSSTSNSSTGTQGSFSPSEQKDDLFASEDGNSRGSQSTHSGSKTQSDFSDSTTKTKHGKTTRTDKLPNIATEGLRNSAKARQKGKKRKKYHSKNNASRRGNQAVKLIHLENPNVSKENPGETKYGLDVKRNCIPGWDITRPYTYSYFPKIKQKKDKLSKQNDGNTLVG